MDGLEKRLVSEGKGDDVADLNPPTLAHDETIVDTNQDQAKPQSPDKTTPNHPHVVDQATQGISPTRPRYPPQLPHREPDMTANITQIAVANARPQFLSGYLLCQTPWKTILHP